MNDYTRAAVWARFMAGALANPAHADAPHLADYVARCARAADFALKAALEREGKPDVAREALALACEQMEQCERMFSEDVEFNAALAAVRAALKGTK